MITWPSAPATALPGPNRAARIRSDDPRLRISRYGSAPLWTATDREFVVPAAPVTVPSGACFRRPLSQPVGRATLVSATAQSLRPHLLQPAKDAPQYLWPQACPVEHPEGGPLQMRSVAFVSVPRTVAS